MFKTRAICALALTAAATQLGVLAYAKPVSAQDSVVRPGDGVVSGSHLEPYESAWDYSHQNAEGVIEEIGTWTDRLEVVVEGDERRLVRTQRFPGASAYQVLTNVVNQEDLAPRSFTIANDAGIPLQKVEFTSSGLEVNMAGQPSSIHLPLQGPVFDWFLYGILAAGFPLAEGYEARFASINGQLQPTERTIRVVGREAIRDQAGNAQPCWVVEMGEGLTFWIGEEAPYLLQVRKDLGDDTWNQWDLVREAPESALSNFVELRVYQIVPGQQENFLGHFDGNYVESQEELGMRIWGQFRDVEASNFVWLRGYSDLEARPDALVSFYTGPVWQSTGDKVREMMAARAEHVHFLEPLSPGSGFSDALVRDEAQMDRGVVVAQLFHRPDDVAGFEAALSEGMIPAFEREGAHSIGLFASSDQPNNFPALPYLEDEPVIAWFATYADRAAYEQAVGNVESSVEPFETFVLDPSARSRIYHRPPH